jgi:hypothetical protein
VQDWSIVDSTTSKVRDARREEAPGTGDEAALKVHPVLSVGGGAPGQDPCRPAREPASPPLQSAASWRGDGGLADVAYARLARLRAGAPDDVRVVIRLKDTWKPQVESIARGQVPRAFCPGTALEALLAEDIRRLDGRASDADGPVGGGTTPWPLRLVGVQTPQGAGVFLTNLPPRSGLRQGAARYRVRWEVERRIKLAASVPRLDQIDAGRAGALKTLRHASLVASTIAVVLAHRPHLSTRPPQAGASRTKAPLHIRRLAWPMAVSSQGIAHALELTGTAAKRRGAKRAELLTQAGTDPHWRRRPSVLIQRRGWKRQPVARNTNDTHRSQMAA